MVLTLPRASMSAILMNKIIFFDGKRTSKSLKDYLVDTYYFIILGEEIIKTG